MQFEEGRRPNLTSDFVQDVSSRLGLEFRPGGADDPATSFGPEDIFNYAYAVFHSPTYRCRYDRLLKMDFPRLPLTSDATLFGRLAAKGNELTQLHLLEALSIGAFITHYTISGSDVVERVTYDAARKRVYINKTQYFDGITSQVWEFSVGGHRICQK